MAALTNDALGRQALANDASFQRRVKSALGNVAWQVLSEDPATAGHTTRAAYARTVLGDLSSAAARTALWLVERTNFVGSALDLSLDQGVPLVATNATDAAMQSQLMSDWSAIAGA